jgi:hypothetical protein
MFLISPTNTSSLYLLSRLFKATTRRCFVRSVAMAQLNIFEVNRVGEWEVDVQTTEASTAQGSNGK